MLKRILIISLMLLSGSSVADEIRIAVASNFTHALTRLANQFESETGNKVTLIVGSTGQHYAQIKNGAPFDAFFAADINRPELLDEEGIALPGSRFTYATGNLVLWCADDTLENPVKLLQQGEFRFLAIANPKLAPYGKAAQEVLRALGVWDELKNKMVRGENIGQTYQFVKTRSAKLGFVAYSQIKTQSRKSAGSFWEIPQSLYKPIEQQAVLLKENKIARAFWSYIKSQDAQKIIRKFGYETPLGGVEYTSTM